jgi:hypothetical protein
MIRFPRIAAAALLALGLAPVAGHAFDPTTQPAAIYAVTGSGESSNQDRLSPGTLVGGALVRSIGSGESAEQVVIATPVAQAPAFARVVGNGNNQMTIHATTLEALDQLARQGRG